MQTLFNFLISALVVLVAAYIVPGVAVDSLFTAFIVAVVLGLLNSFVKPILVILTLPINILTLGLFSIVINIFILFLADSLISGFEISSIFSALLFGIALAVINYFISSRDKAVSA